MQDRDTLAGTRILVTGGTGFIGSRLLMRLSELNAQVCAVSRKRQRETRTKVQWYQGDLADPSTARSLVEAIKPQIIYHLAGHVVGERGADAIVPTLYGNLLTTVNLLTSANAVGCKRCILSSSLEEPSSDAGELVPSSPYAASKWAGSAYARMFHALYQFPAVILRVFMVYGPGQRDVNKLIPYVIRSFLTGQVPELTSGRRGIDWIYVDDVVEAFIAAAVAEQIEGKTIDIGSGKLETVRELVRRLARLMNQEAAPPFGSKPDRVLEQVRVADLHAAEKHLQWTPRVPLEEGLRRTIGWYECEFGPSTTDYAMALHDDTSTERA